MVNKLKRWKVKHMTRVGIVTYGEQRRATRIKQAKKIGGKVLEGAKRIGRGLNRMSGSTGKGKKKGSASNYLSNVYKNFYGR